MIQHPDLFSPIDSPTEVVLAVLPYQSVKGEKQQFSKRS
jgi:hypothetical protein